MESLNELRQDIGRDPVDDDLGDAPLNPSLVGPWLQIQQALQQGGGDFGVPQDEEGGEGGPQDGQDQPGGKQEQDEAKDGKGFGGEPQDEGFGLATKAMPIYVID